ncbi:MULTISPECIES: hypothetical protein [unclassified Ruegeria]|uniref:hypothetical protein n=1 Tax=unclassified Ruegeria TaxID=2625375 RepID=UPI0014913D0C|nr:MULTISPECIES: hypothetical protein [unclassified Ruegeria]NOD46723.1 hypothetical protein [Ruegeria sp. HKCCD5849]NOD51046.1 hypothetical protein [Ruegeria sp. HKCCD5851]NOD67865.1 hypothetical protein [Ruegeria sp. HKCCD7303]
MTDRQTKVLILGSAPSALEARAWSRQPFTHIVAINNAWRIREDWDYLIHPEDFPTDRCPKDVTKAQSIVTAQDYVPKQNEYGGFVYAGGTMAFTAGYWALAALNPDVLAFFGCDMMYSGSGKTHFYGTGAADPLRDDVTLRSLEAKSARLALFAAKQGCRAVRLSNGPSRLVFSSTSRSNLSASPLIDTLGMGPARQIEHDLGYYVDSGRYWEVEERFDPAKIDALDRMWLRAYRMGALKEAA